MKRRQFTQTLSAALVVSASITTLGGCGFKMRGAFKYPFQSIYTNFVLGSPLGNEFKRVLGADAQVKLITDAAQADKAQVVLDVLNDQREKVVVGITAAGQVREFQLRIRLKFKLRSQDGRDILPETELLIQRDISFTETTALAKENEEALLYRDMQSDLVQQLLRRLAAAKSL